MVTLDKFDRKFEAPLIQLVPLIAAGIGAGAAVYTANKAEDAAERKAKIDANARNEAQSLREAEAKGEIDRSQSQAAQKEIVNNEATNAQISSMQSVAEAEKNKREQDKLLAAERVQAEYAGKFKPGQSEGGEGSASDFLVPKVADDTALIRTPSDQGGSGLVTPLTFDV